ncbi:MAG: tetratricopeptide repeat protein [Planctomycetes bacterium]|nr:tetratricopeptide repeat protein [Planctomycetota bacterium]
MFPKTKTMVPAAWLVAAVLPLLVGLTVGCAAKKQKQLEVEAVDHYVKAKLLLDADNLDLALVELMKAVEAYPTLATAHASIGDIYRKKNDYPKAVHAYERAVQANRYSFRNHYNCAFLHQMLAGTVKAVEATRTHLLRAVQLYLRAIQLNGDDYDTTLNLSVCHYRLGQYDQAEQQCKRALELDDKPADAYTNLGAIYDRQGKYYSAISMYRQSLERNSNQPAVMMNLAAVYVRQGKLASAIRDYEIASKMDPLSPSPLERLGYCYYFMQQFDKATEYYEAAIAVDSDFAAARRGLGVVFMTQYLLDKKNTELRDRALAEWEASLEINPDQPDLARLIEKYAPKFTVPQL